MSLFSSGGKHAANPTPTEGSRSAAPDKRSAEPRRPAQRPAQSQRSAQRPAEPQRSAQPQARRSSGVSLSKVLIVVLALVFLVTGTMAVRKFTQLYREQRDLRELLEQKEEIEQTLDYPPVAPEIAVTPVPPSETAKTNGTNADGTGENHIRGNENRTEPMLPQYAPMYSQNTDLFGWINVPGTRINYPVMHTPGDNEKYLHTDFKGQYSFSGTPFLDAGATADSDQLLIYGHNMKNGSMFHDLFKYDNMYFWKEHPTIKLDTLYDQYEFEIMAVVYDRVYYKTEDCFKFYKFIDAENKEEFDEAVAYYKKKALYDTGVTAEYGDQLLVLATCSYHTEDGRLLLIGRKVP